VEILIDNDFCSEPVTLDSPAFTLSEDEYDLVYKLAVNKEVKSQFSTFEKGQERTATTAEKSFYGEPSSILVMDKYIQLPSLKDYFYELPTPVNIRKKHGHDYFKFTGSQAEMSIYDPLVLIDWVAVEDVDKILALSPQLISRIEFVNAPYVKGNLIYGGILNFISVKGDFAGIDLPSSGLFINFSFLSEDDQCLSEISFEENEPDARNTVSWEPRIIIEDNEAIEFRVRIPDTPGEYMVLIRGLGSNGKVIISKRTFENR
jgi:hypothetical protein